MTDGWNGGNGNAFAAQYTDDGDFIGFDDACMKGRQELLHFIKCFSTNFLKVVVLFCAKRS
jgi:uncharacterized protein (TIGR02246 family)